MRLGLIPQLYSTLTGILILLRKGPVPGRVPISELGISFAKSVEGVIIHRSINRLQIIVDTLPDSHEFDGRNQSHVILDGQRML